jgi:energy-coupling factor transporter transmembrane protein EcfT
LSVCCYECVVGNGYIVYILVYIYCIHMCVCARARFDILWPVSWLLLLLLLLFILTANGFSPGGSGTTIRHNTQKMHDITIPL